MNIIFKDNTTVECKFVSDQIDHFRQLKEPAAKQISSYGFFLMEENCIYGGIYGQIFLKCLQIHELWIDESLRRKGYGSALLARTEEYSLSKGATFVVIGSYEYYGALDFYLKNGYFIEYERKGFENRWSQFLLRKNFESFDHAS